MVFSKLAYAVMSPLLTHLHKIKIHSLRLILLCCLFLHLKGSSWTEARENERQRGEKTTRG